ncbi:hypothetical protein [Streptomyces sp. NBC_00847]|uniref:hypothetical protein n=1 Tax=Streptomyces sp. NBC_00847 TaxID=2975850 RepID=UPI00225DED19|nr:hypothetical protein [Streptomyces sp. NBC_00847]MCX4885908.1 hypothetical protein [Streptomyces sp. NBC_00847]
MTTPTVTTEAENAIDNLMDAADAFVRALQTAADQDTHNRAYWAGFIAQIKHVTEHGGASLVAVEAEAVPAPDGSANRARMDALFDARQALEKASELTFRASVTFGRSDDKLTA